jgi:hypothetical protein
MRRFILSIVVSLLACVPVVAQVSGSFTLSTNNFVNALTNSTATASVQILGTKSVGVVVQYTTLTNNAALTFGTGTNTVQFQGTFDASPTASSIWFQPTTNFTLQCSQGTTTGTVTSAQATLDTTFVQSLRIQSMGLSATNSIATNISVFYFYK